MSKEGKISVVIFGGKLLGLATAIEIKRRYREMDVTVVEKTTFLTSDNHTLDKSATLSSTKTLHSGTYYTHRGHSRGTNPKEAELLVNLTDETSRVYNTMLWILEDYGIGPQEKDKQTMYLMFQDAFIEPHQFESITKDRKLWLQRVPEHEFERLKKIFSRYEGYDGKPLHLEGAFYSKDVLAELTQLIIKFEQDAKQIGVNFVEEAKLAGVGKDFVSVISKGKEMKIKADCIINATNAFTTPVAKMLTAEPPPKESYIVQYRHIASIDKKAAPIFEEVTQGKSSFFRTFQGDNKNTFAEVIGNRNHVSMYAPELMYVPNDRPDDVFLQDSRKNKSLLKMLERLGVDFRDKSFRAYIGMSAYMENAKNLYHETATKTGIPMMNGLIEKYSGFIEAAPHIADWACSVTKGRLPVTIVGAGKYGSILAGPKYRKQKRVFLKSVVSPTIPEDRFFRSPLTGLPLQRSAAEWKQKNSITEKDVFDLAVHNKDLISVVKDFVSIGAKNFVFPKPMAITKEQLKELKKIKEENDLKVAVASQWHYAHISKRALSAIEKIRKTSRIISVDADFSQFFNDERIKSYTPTTALLPHILEILYGMKIISETSKFKVAEADSYKIQLHTLGLDGEEVVIKSNIRSQEKKRTVIVTYEDPENREKTRVMTVDYLGLLEGDYWVHYPSIEMDGKKKEIVEDNLENMINSIVDSFLFNRVEENGILTFDKYVPIANIQIKIEDRYRKMLKGAK